LPPDSRGFAPDPGKRPDYLIEGRYFDSAAPESGNAGSFLSNLSDKKIAVRQTERLILKLDDSSATASDVVASLRDYPIPGLKEVIVIKNGVVTPVFP
ncbi:MAG: hypothetical protein AB1758_21875, partial [Candidatus Eremiobacterota bacterium]